ncbi:glycosyltransferase [Tumidithrix elongata RA019]|uniref:Glycosyltransferase n=1 Tax=Tumidithrix elongata BACA0141 TaxID=2716417 RepID=A0AAW9PSI5_9CYAN|nr:glycosyltransferase [Tumidithrix elongata RA019]
MSKISLLIPTLRPTEILQRIEEFAETNANVDYEIVVVSPFLVTGDRVVHVREETPSGTVAAMNLAYKKSSGEYVVYLSDDVSPAINCLSIMLDFIKTKKEPFIAGFSPQYMSGEKFPVFSVYGRLYAGWGCISKGTAEMVGGLFNPSYRTAWVDPDLCLRVWLLGGRVEVCEDAVLIVKDIHDSIKSDNLKNYFDKDKEIFFNEWHDKLGEGVDKHWAMENWEFVNNPGFEYIYKRLLESKQKTELELRQKIEAMESSRFWKLRNFWHQLKNRLKNG